MDKLLSALSPILEKLTIKRVIALGLVIAFLLSGYIGYQQSEQLGRILTKQQAALPPPKPVLADISAISEGAVNSFMKQNPYVSYLTILRFEFAKNLRVPIHRAFNDQELRTLVYERLRGGDGALPIFIKNDETNNSQMISIIEGTITCNEFTDGGLARVWPDLSKKLLMSCRMPLPPGYGSGAKGYIVVHLWKKPIGEYNQDKFKNDLATLSQFIATTELLK